MARLDAIGTSSDAIVDPIFVGGTGRCGTTIVGQLLDQSASIALTRPPELHFLTDEDGLVEVIDTPRRQPPELYRKLRKRAYRSIGGLESDRYLAGSRQTPDRFACLLQARWYDRAGQRGNIRGLVEEVDRADVARVAREFGSEYRRDRVEAARSLLHQIVDPMARRRGKTCWVDTTPPNVRSSVGLFRIYPRLRLINVIRDGRDVAASMTHRLWAPDDVLEAIRYWHDLMLEGHRAMAQLPNDRVLTIQMEDLVSRDRKATFERIVMFLKLEDVASMREWFDSELDAGRGRVGRWRQDLPAERALQVDRLYGEVLTSLRAVGVTVPQGD